MHFCSIPGPISLTANWYIDPDITYITTWVFICYFMTRCHMGCPKIVLGGSLAPFLCLCDCPWGTPCFGAADTRTALWTTKHPMSSQRRQSSEYGSVWCVTVQTLFGGVKVKESYLIPPHGQLEDRSHLHILPDCISPACLKPSVYSKVH